MHTQLDRQQNLTDSSNFIFRSHQDAGRLLLLRRITICILVRKAMRPELLPRPPHLDGKDIANCWACRFVRLEDLPGLVLDLPIKHEERIKALVEGMAEAAVHPFSLFATSLRRAYRKAGPGSICGFHPNLRRRFGGAS